MISKMVKEAANKATEIAKTYDGITAAAHAGIEHGIAQATAGQPRSFVMAVRAELRTRGYRI